MINREKARERAKGLVEQMTVEEMVSQLKFDAPAIERLNIPVYNWWNEGLHGVARAGTATVFPQAIAMAASWNRALLFRMGEAVALEARAKYNASRAHGDRDIYKGLTLWTPNVNIFRDPRWGRGHETLGEDPCLTASLAVEEIKGLQGEGPYLKTAACAKHFAVHSGPEHLRHSFDARAGKKDLFETYLPAFAACVKEARVEAVMGAYNRTNGAPCCASQELMEEILRGKWGFEGHYVSDCWAIRDFHEHHGVAKNGVESSAMALNAGCDLNCGCSYLCLMEAYRKKLVKKQAIQEAAIRLFTTRFLLGMFEETEYDSIPYTVVESKEHLELAAEAAGESIVLLKNNGILPLSLEKIKTIGVIGPNANSRSSLDGNYHGTASRYVTALEGIQDYAGDRARILYSQGCHLFQDKTEALAQADDRISEALAVAEHSDVVILCLGLDEKLEGEEGDTGNAYSSGDKKDLAFPPSQERLLEALLNTGKPLILCSFTGSAMDLALAKERADGILQVWYPGAQGGRALAQILFGEISPSGRLPITFYQDLSGFGEFTDYSMTGRTYRYLTKEPLYPFGFGLSYGRALVEEASLEYTPGSREEVLVKVKLKNHSLISLKEVVQIYVKNESPLAPPHPVLCGFEKVALAPGEEREIQIILAWEVFLVVNEEGERVLDSKQAMVYVGTSGPDETSIALTGARPRILSIELR